MDKTFEEEQRHLSEVYATICSLRDELTADLERHHATAARDLKDLSGHIEYDGTTWGQGTWCFGAKYFFHSDDFSKTLSLYAMYETFRGFGEADIPIKFTAVWGLSNLFGVKGLTFKGFADLWGNNTLWNLGDETKWSFLTEPQLWMNLGSLFDGHLDIGTEIELSYNFAGNKGFMCNPCAGLRWSF